MRFVAAQLYAAAAVPAQQSVLDAMIEAAANRGQTWRPIRSNRRMRAKRMSGDASTTHVSLTMDFVFTEREARFLVLVIRIIQLMLGHASIQQTQGYLNVTDEELRRGLEVSWNNKGRPLRLASGA